jgi:polyhydroxybutyrate depolymerase
LALLYGLLLGCGGAASRSVPRPEADAGLADAAATTEPPVEPLLVDRPYRVTVPVGVSATRPAPLVVLLHGYTMTSQTQDMVFRMSELARQQGFVVALPDGRVDAQGFQYWNATDACCAFGKPTDDVAWLSAVIRDVRARYPVDARRTFLVGYSNGGFMAHRLACERADLVAGIASVAGSTWADVSRCRPTQPVAVLQVHGTADAIIPFDGGATFGPPFPAAEVTVGAWARLNGCGAVPFTAVSPDLDLEPTLPGDETKRTSASGCPPGGAVELWTMRGASHGPTLSDDFASRLVAWLLAHSRP